jgi:hypothetical protein
LKERNSRRVEVRPERVGGISMECKEMLKELSEYIDGELDPSLCAQLECHMKDCHPCLIFINTLKKTISLYKYAASEPLPKEVHLRLHDFLRKKCQET